MPSCRRAIYPRRSSNDVCRKMSVLQRLKKLEAEESKSKRVRLLFWEKGESEDECIKRHGYSPDEKEIEFILVGWLDANI